MLASRVSTCLPQHDRAALIETHNVERVLADIDANHRDRSIEFLRHGVLLALVAPMPALLAGGAGARPDHSITGPRQLLFSFNVLPNGTIRPGAHVRRNDRAAFRPPLVLLDAMPARQRIPAPLRSSRRQYPTGAPAGTCAPDATHWS